MDTTDFLCIPDFLRVENRVPLSPEQKTKVDAWLKKGRRASKAEKTFGTRRPQSWDATCERLQREMDIQKETKKRERLAALKERNRR